ncbi:MAG: RodZ domain-containing protein [Pseudomonadota bacterium]
MSDEALSVPPEGPGKTLRAARRAMNVEVREVADALNLPPPSIEAIERNDFGELPNLVFARGYVRAYAKLVELDPDPVVAAFQAAAMPAEEPTPMPTTQSVPVDEHPLAVTLAQWRYRFERFAQNQPQAFLGLLGALVLLLVLLLWAAFSGGDEAEAATAPTEAPASGLAQIGASAAGGNGGRLDGSAESVGSVPADVSGDAGFDPGSSAGGVSAGGILDAEPYTEPGAAAADSPDFQATGTALTINDGDDRLGFNFVADCWVEVRDEAGSLLYGNLGKAGADLQLRGSGPFRILLGYAPGANLAYNGEPVPLAPHTRNDVARLVLGQ